jgi:bifunctional N-acetylglucosamine-1-phosphate-uridyltransferase/glucosamine-1-phosphate-acetyltransferase GlmU-like protein
MKSKPTLVILAAGIGSRYGGLKQADTLGPNGESIIEYSIYDAIRSGFGKVVLVIRKSIEKDFKDKFDGLFHGKIEVKYVFQELDSPIKGITNFPARTKPWGTGHAMLMAAPMVNEPFVVINADDYYGLDSFQKISKYLNQYCTPNNYCMVGFKLKNTLSENGSVSRGVCTRNSKNKLTSVIERTKIIRESDNTINFYENEDKTQLSDDTIVSMNFWGFHPNVFEKARLMFVDFIKNIADNSTSEFYIPKVANDCIESKSAQLHVMTSDSQWYGVTYKEDKEIVQKALKELTEEGKYPTNLWQVTKANK